MNSANHRGASGRQTEPAGVHRTACFGTSKIQGHHRERLAVVYVRQSTPRQVRDNIESTALQYQLVHRAVELGWHQDRVLVIDDDLGQSAETASQRVGFQRLLAEVGLNHVGLVLGIEMSRLARSNKDWHQLLELCAVFQSLLADQDGVYNLTDYNDRLLLGLKGTMSEAELHLIRTRMEQGKRHKAERGELFSLLPIGYVYLAPGEVAMDPDQQIQSVLHLVFDKFAQLGTGRAVVHYLRQHEIHLPVRRYNGLRPSPLEWHLPTDVMVYRILKHPIYAGAYVHGRRILDPQRKQSGQSRSGVVTVPMDQWQVLLRDHLPAYIPWEQYLANRGRLRQNVSGWDTVGAPRQGMALLGGLLYCSRCGYRMQVHYPAVHRGVYRCTHFERSGEQERCPSFPAAHLDALVSQQLLRALEPAALELSLQACANLEQERQRLHRHWQQQLERARYQAERAKRQFDAVEPENRLVARELESQWEKALLDQRQLEEEFARSQQSLPAAPTRADLEAIRALAHDIPQIWDASTTTAVDRQIVLRQLVERVQVQVQGTSEVASVAIHWKGGFVSEHPLHRPLARYGQMGDYQRLLDRLKQLRATRLTSAAIADRLNAEGFRTPKGKAFSAWIIRTLLSREGLSPSRGTLLFPGGCGHDEWWLGDLARALNMSAGGLQGWVKRGWVHARQVPTGGRYWIIWADGDELSRLRKLRAHGRPPFPAKLITPKARPKCNNQRGKKGKQSNSKKGHKND
jgi:DNA invertase Pin-like site-specific DNA recombinase